MHGEHDRACPSRSVPRLWCLRQHLGAQLCRQPPQPGQTRLNSGRQRLHLPCAAWLGLSGAPSAPQCPRAVPGAAPWRPRAGSLQRGRDLLYGY